MLKTQIKLPSFLKVLLLSAGLLCLFGIKPKAHSLNENNKQLIEFRASFFYSLQKLEPPVENKSGYISIVLVIALFTILSLLIISLYKNNKLRAKANEVLKAKNVQLTLAKEEAEKASVIKAQFLSTITHELRTPMYAVTGLTHLLLKEDPTTEQKEHLQSLKFSGDYLLALINNILDLSKLEANKVEIDKKPFNFKNKLEEVILAMKETFSKKVNQIKLEYDNTIPEFVEGDPLMLSQILINLIGNANKFTNGGNIYVRSKLVNQNKKACEIQIEVEDSGEGISQKKLNDIFQNFTQGSIHVNRKYGGTGLGLAIVKRLLEVQGSKIEVSSKLGEGSKFFFRIKYKIVNEKIALEKTAVDYQSLKGIHILIVEDNKINQMVTRKILEKNHITCEIASNGEIGILKAKEKQYDLILMDIHMPVMSGIIATKKIREFDQKTPIVALTAVTLDEQMGDLTQKGFNDIIPKPYDIEEFLLKIQTAVTKARLA